MSLSDRQQAHYDAILDAYDRHYYDKWSLKYREEFLLKPLVGQDDLNNRVVVDLACGSGHTSLALRQWFPSVRLVGVDISPRACASYEATVGAEAHVTDLTRTSVACQADVAIMIGGLHHCIADLPSTLTNIAHMIRPGGTFLLAEPNADCWWEAIRAMWYRVDGFFDAATERALSHDRIVAQASSFAPLQVSYIGGPAYFLVLNSLIFRLPLSVKGWTAPSLLWLERRWQTVAHRAPRACPFFLARWRRLGEPS